MTLQDVLRDMIDPALALLPERMSSPAAKAMLLAIGLQESRFKHREQVKGPAKGYFQFEQGGGVRGVLSHPSSKAYAEEVCRARNVFPKEREVYLALAKDDILAAAFARLLLWTDPQPLPTNADDAWKLYLRTWRPGKPHRHTWDAFYQQAQEAVHGMV